MDWKHLGAEALLRFYLQTQQLSPRRECGRPSDCVSPEWFASC